jgi:predicted small integral membrane protein
MFFVGFVIDILGLVVSALAGWACWNMYIPGAFPGVPPLTFASAVGVVVVTSLLGAGQKYSVKELKNFRAWDAIGTSVINSVAKPLTILAYAGVAHALLF